jgi:hypothetical protein
LWAIVTPHLQLDIARHVQRKAVNAPPCHLRMLQETTTLYI